MIVGGRHQYRTHPSLDELCGLATVLKLHVLLFAGDGLVGKQDSAARRLDLLAVVPPGSDKPVAACHIDSEDIEAAARRCLTTLKEATA